MSDISINTLGDRITYCRSSLCLTRKDLVEQWGYASVPTLARWELDIIRIPIKKLELLLIFFNENNLIVSKEWLATGFGVPPLLLKSDCFDEDDFDSFAQKQLLNINKGTRNFIFGQVQDAFMNPIIKYGDYVAGINTLDKSVDFSAGEIIFIKKHNRITVGLLIEYDEKIKIRNIEKAIKIIDLHNIEAIGKVQWIIRR